MKFRVLFCNDAWGKSLSVLAWAGMALLMTVGSAAACSPPGPELD